MRKQLPAEQLFIITGENNKLINFLHLQCFDEHKVNPAYLAPIQQCFEGPAGDQLLKANGELTHAIRPRISFIPTVTLDGALLNQADILRDLLTAVCTELRRDPPPEVCQKQHQQQHH